MADLLRLSLAKVELFRPSLDESSHNAQRRCPIAACVDVTIAARRGKLENALARSTLIPPGQAVFVRSDVTVARGPEHHWYFVLAVRPDGVRGWSDDEVAERWQRIYRSRCGKRTVARRAQTLANSGRAQFVRVVLSFILLPVPESLLFPR